jgi:hypothetical protein
MARLGVTRPDDGDPNGRYEVRQHMVPGVLGVFWVDRDSPASGDLQMVLGEARLGKLEAALAKARIAARSGRA